jgi:ABC-type transport system substrate-binding protein
MAVNSFIFPASATPIDLSAVPPGNGVYRQSSVAIGDHITVVASPRARGLSTAKAKSITFRGIADDAARVAALEAGDVDWINNVPPDSIDELASKGFLINSQPSIRNMYITFNFKKPGPWHDERVRQAMNYAIDKNAINKALFAGRAHISVAPEPPQIAYTPTGLPPYTYNPQKAKQLLAAAGYANGFNGGTLVAPAGRYLKDKETAEAVQAALSEFGIQYKLLTLDIATFFDQAPNYELGLASWTATEGDPAAGLYGEATFQFPYDLGGYDTDVTPRLRKALVEGTTIFDEKKATRFYGQLERQVWLQAPRIFLFELPMIWAHRKGLAGFTAVPTDDYDWTQVRIS